MLSINLHIMCCPSLLLKCFLRVYILISCLRFCMPFVTMTLKSICHVLHRNLHAKCGTRVYMPCVALKCSSHMLPRSLHAKYCLEVYMSYVALESTCHLLPWSLHVKCSQVSLESMSHVTTESTCHFCPEANV